MCLPVLCEAAEVVSTVDDDDDGWLAVPVRTCVYRHLLTSLNSYKNATITVILQFRNYLTENTSMIKGKNFKAIFLWIA